MPVESLREKVQRLADAAAIAPAPSDDAGAERKLRNLIDRFNAENGVPAKYAAAAFGALDHLPAELRRDYHAATEDLRSLNYKPGIIVLLGPRGVGKTHMACALVREFCGAGKSAVYAEAMDYFLRLDEQINARGSVLKVEQEFLKPALLVLDAMEERADTPAKDRMLTRLINKRYSAELSTVLITNEDADKFANRVGPSVSDRIHDDGQTILCDWKSLRGRIAEASC